MKTGTLASYLQKTANIKIENFPDIVFENNIVAEKVLSLNIHASLIKAHDVSPVHDVVLALRYYPQLMGELFFSLSFTFSETQGSKLHIANRILHLQPDYYRWFNKIMDIPFMLFFLRNKEDQYYALIGDMIAEDKVQTDYLPSNSIPSFYLTAQQFHILQERLFQSCHSLIAFCETASFDPTVYIQSLIKSFEVSFTIEDVVRDKRMIA